MISFSDSQEACPHTWSDDAMKTPSFQQVVHRDECAYCCLQCHQDDGIYVCMSCFTGVCRHHVSKHLNLCSGHCLYTRIKELPVDKPKVEETKDVQTLCLVPNKKYESDICCAECMVKFSTTQGELPGLSGESYSAIINAPVPGAAPDTADMTGFQPIPCAHLLLLEQTVNPFVGELKPPTSGEVKCNEPNCNCTENCWMCMSCGFIGCPRASSGGNGHALLHRNNTDHTCAVKLGTITPQGADVYCYMCDDMVSDEYLDAHMKFFGIDIATSKKTAKTMGELEYDYSTSFDFNKITEAGEDLEVVRGPGRTGIKNIGNSCYISSVVQCLMAMPSFQRAFYPSGKTPHQEVCTADPYKCYHCQIERVAEGLQSGKYCTPDPGRSEEEKKASTDETGGICPRLMKTVFAGTHPEFSTGSQQDAQEYFLFLLEKLQQNIHLPPALQDTTANGMAVHPASLFNMKVENRVECVRCKKVRYSTDEDACLSLPLPIAQDLMVSTSERNVGLAEDKKCRPIFTLQECIDAAFEQNSVDCRCEACGKDTTYQNTMRLETFPNVLPIFIRRAYFDPTTLTTKKFEAFVNVPQEIDLNRYKAVGQKAGEVLMEPSSDRTSQRMRTEMMSTGGAGEDQVDAVAVATVASMGFDIKPATFALKKHKGDVEKAIEYLCSGADVEMEMMIAESIAEAEASPSEPKVFTNGDGKYHLTAMISHIGAAAKMGHYVCHIKEKSTGKWLLFNDEKVGISQSPPFTLASLYFFERAC